MVESSFVLIRAPGPSTELSLMKRLFLPSFSVCFGVLATILFAGDIHGDERPTARAGRVLFQKSWSPRRSSNGGDGLGPLFNAISCSSCHHQGGLGGGGDARFNATTIGIDALFFRYPRRLPNVNARKLELIRSFFPGFVSRGGSVQSSVPLPHRGGTPMFQAARSTVLNATLAKFSDVGGPNDAEEVRRLWESPLVHASGDTRVTMTIQATVFQRNTTSLFGAGLIDTIPDLAIRQQAQRQKRHKEISGRPSVQLDGNLGRFGWRANATSLNDFVDRACAAELGLQTNNQRQAVDPGTPNYSNSSTDISDEQVMAMTMFIASLPRPHQQWPEDTHRRQEIQQGENVFKRIGCAICHVPHLGEIQGLYSDLLLHDMGRELYDYDAAEAPPVSQVQSMGSSRVRFVVNRSSFGYYGKSPTVTRPSQPVSPGSAPGPPIVPDRYTSLPDLVPSPSFLASVNDQTVPRMRESSRHSAKRSDGSTPRFAPQSNSRLGTVTTQEWRTPPLWGVRDSAPYMHDGRAATLLEAITLHGGESQPTRDRFLNLPLADRNAILAFLGSLVAPPDGPAEKL